MRLVEVNRGGKGRLVTRILKWREGIGLLVSRYYGTCIGSRLVLWISLASLAAQRSTLHVNTPKISSLRSPALRVTWRLGRISAVYCLATGNWSDDGSDSWGLRFRGRRGSSRCSFQWSAWNIVCCSLHGHFLCALSDLHYKQITSHMHAQVDHNNSVLFAMRQEIRYDSGNRVSASASDMIYPLNSRCDSLIS